MHTAEFTFSSFWWIVPIIMMIVCCLMMKSRRGSLMCGFGSRNIDIHETGDSRTALEILDKRYASGQIDKDEYQEIKKTLTGSTDIQLRAAVD